MGNSREMVGQIEREKDSEGKGEGKEEETRAEMMRPKTL